MKIKVKNKSYAQVAAMPRPEHRKPLRPHIFFRALIRAAGEEVQRADVPRGQLFLRWLRHTAAP